MTMELYETDLSQLQSFIANKKPEGRRQWKHFLKK